MAPRFKVSREEILDTALRILDEGSSVTTRAIAERLGVSTRPIYSFFPSMETLLSELGVACTKVLRDYVHHGYTDNSFLNTGVGFVMFYKERPHLADFLEKSYRGERLMELDSGLEEEFLKTVAGSPELKGLTREDARALHEKMSLFTSGIIMYVRTGYRDYSLGEIIELLEKTGEALFVHHRWEMSGKPGY